VSGVRKLKPETFIERTCMRLVKAIGFYFNVIISSLCVISASLAGDAPDKLIVYTVNYPLQYFAERIGGEYVKVVFPAPADVDPAYWIPDKKTISDYQKADLILLNGAHYAKWVEKVTLPESRMVNTSRKFRDKYIRLGSAVTHSHGSEGVHAHEDAAFTTWIDLNLAAKQAKVIERALSLKMPNNKSTFKKNFASLEEELMELDKDIKAITMKDPTKPLVVSHPVYDYLASRYGLNVQSVHWEPDEMPGVSQWMEFKAILNNHPAKWMIWEGKPLNEAVKKLNSLGVKSIVFDPCGNVPDRGDFLTVMQKNIESLRSAF
jgi:zinc transport system substrate-binding protein